MHDASTSRPSSDTGTGARLAAVALAIALGACDRFPRDNPVERAGDEPVPTLARSDAPIVVSDPVGGGPFNNGNGIAEPRESVTLSVPLDVQHVEERLTARVTVEDLDDGRCLTSLGAGSALQSVAVPQTTGDASAAVLVTPIELVLGSEGCEPDPPLQLELRFHAVELDQDFTLTVELVVGELDGELALDDVVIDDDGGDGAQDLDAAETVVLYPSLENTGDAVLRAVSLDVASDGRSCVDDVRIRRSPSARLELGDVAPGETVSGGAGALELTVDSACSEGDEVELVFDVRDASEQHWSLPWSSPIASGVDAGTPDDDAGREMP